MEANLELYKIFYIVAEKENITKASEELHISQPAITKQIKNLDPLAMTPMEALNFLYELQKKLK